MKYNWGFKKCWYLNRHCPEEKNPGNLARWPRADAWAARQMRIVFLTLVKSNHAFLEADSEGGIPSVVTLLCERRSLCISVELSVIRFIVHHKDYTRNTIGVVDSQLDVIRGKYKWLWILLHENPKIVTEDSWSDSDESTHEEMNESCLMAFGSQARIKALLRDKRSLQQETNKLANIAKELELEFDETKGIKTKEVVE
ncbi:hypothetical protein Tco_0054565 [Tanacetum coccineum]